MDSNGLWTSLLSMSQWTQINKYKIHTYDHMVTWSIVDIISATVTMMCLCLMLELGRLNLDILNNYHLTQLWNGKWTSFKLLMFLIDISWVHSQTDNMLCVVSSVSLSLYMLCVCAFVLCVDGLHSSDVWHHLDQFAKRSAASSMKSIVVMNEKPDHVWRRPVM